MYITWILTTSQPGHTMWDAVIKMLLVLCRLFTPGIYNRKFSQQQYHHLYIRGVTGKFFWVGKVIFPDFFSWHEILFPSRKFPFCWTQNKFWCFGEKKVLSSFVTFPPSIFNFPSSLLQFSFFSSQFSPLFPFFLASFFPGRSAQISRSQVSGGGGGGALSPACYATALYSFMCGLCFIDEY